MGREAHHGTSRGQGGKCTSVVTETHAETHALLSINTWVEPLYQPLQMAHGFKWLARGLNGWPRGFNGWPRGLNGWPRPKVWGKAK